MADPSDTGSEVGDSDRQCATSSGTADRTAVVERLYDDIPFHRRHDLEVLSVTPDRATVRLPFDPGLVGNPDLDVLHGGVVSAVVDLTGAAVFVGGREAYTPTIDLRVNYLEAAGRDPLYATATVDRRGAGIGVASVEVESRDAVCATGTGVYKLTDD
ncbi:hypothetical protein BRD22_04135 [Halobacteriales archaeon SW_8_68_21]|nr:MAG: hypothetical protein BRD22_04135 [Halobacteriales archaeon SW_8_68_21]